MWPILEKEWVLSTKKGMALAVAHNICLSMGVETSISDHQTAGLCRQSDSKVPVRVVGALGGNAPHGFPVSSHRRRLSLFTHYGFFRAVHGLDIASNCAAGTHDFPGFQLTRDFRA